jgi:hypothetical protein
VREKPILLAVENRGDHAGFVAAETVVAVSKDTCASFAVIT